MPYDRTCPSCGTSISDGSLEELCPACLIRSGLDLLKFSAPPSPPTAVSGGSHPRRFGDYELLDEIARGGMGVVYRARQLSLNRIVAVKVLLFGEFASNEFVHRFKIEAAAAASLRHPNIVAIHEVGEHAGQHYFSMDLIEGQSLAELARNGPLPARTVATSIENVARAIHYAHQHGVIHRDLKPSNVLIDAYGQPHITDFGLAKRLADDGNLTTTGQVLGSPNFMPPEQADPTFGPPGPAGDIYSLGALLYHLLTGRPPFIGESVEVTLRQLLQQEPVAPHLLNASIPADLETICLKCLQKEPARRYPTAQALADELRRFLHHEPIHARPIGRLEKFQSWCRREPVLATLTLSLAAVLVAGLLLTTGLLWRERVARLRATAAEQAQSQLRLQVERQKDAATSEAAKSRQLADFLQQMLTRAGPSASLGRDTTLLREVLDQTAQRLESDLTNQSAVIAELRDTIGRTYCDIGDTRKSIAMHREALRLRRELGTERTSESAQNLTLLARALADSGELNEAETLNRTAMSLWQELNGPRDPKVANCLNNLGNVHFRRGEMAKATDCFTQALNIYREHRDPNTSAPIHNLGNILAFERDFAGAETLYREAIALARKEHGDQHPTTALYLRNLGDTLNAQGKLDEASVVLSEALTARANMLDEVHPLLADSFERLGAVKFRQGRWTESETLFRKALTLRRKLSPDNPAEWGDDANFLVESLNAQHRFDDSIQVLTETIHTATNDEPRAARLHAIRGSTRARNGRWHEAVVDLKTAYQMEPTNHWNGFLLAPLLLETKDAAAYKALCSRSLVQFKDAKGDSAAQVALMNLLGPDSTTNLNTVHAIIDRAMATAPTQGTNAYYVAIKALAELRSHEPARAVERLQNLLEDLAAGRLQGGRYLRVQAHAVLAMAHHELGHAPEARQALTLARTIAPAKIQSPPNGDYGVWHEWLLLQLHLREAASLVEGTTGQIPTAGAQ